MGTATAQPPPLSERHFAALQRRYALAENPVWTGFQRHREFCQGWGLFVLLAPELPAVELARRTLHDQVSVSGGQWHQLFLNSDTAPGTVARWLLALPPVTPQSVVWVSASIEFTGGDGPALLTTVWRAQAAILNMQRDLIRSTLACPLILAGPDGLDGVLRESSPDLWSVRESVVRLAPSPAAGDGSAVAFNAESLTFSDYPEDKGDPDLSLSEADRLKDRPEQQLLRADLLRRAGDQFTSRQQWEPAAACLHEAWSIQEERHALPETLARTALGLGVLYLERGNAREAQTWLERHRAIVEAAYPPDAPQVLGSLNNLAILLYQRGDLDGAEPLYRRALESRERTLGPEHPDTLISLNNLAALLDERGDLDGAEPLYRRALEAQERTLGPEHPDTLSSLNNLGALREQQGRLEEAEALYARAVAGAQKLLLPEHPHRQTWERNLARVRAALGKDGG